jgi:signal transduction histidine kinase
MGAAEDQPARSIFAEHQALLFRLARELGPADQLDPVLKTVLAGMRSLVEFRGGTICLIDDRGVYVAAADPQVSPEVAEARVPVGTGLAGRCITEREPVYSPDVTADPRVDQALARSGSNQGMRSYLAAPLICLGEAIGVLQVDSSEVDAFDESDIHLLSGLAAQVAGAIESARRFEQMRQLDADRTAIIARVSHELRTPVTILGGFTRLLMEHPERFEVGEPARDLLRRVDSAAARLQRLVEQLIMASQLDADLAVPSPPERVSITTLLALVGSTSDSPESVTTTCPDGLEAEVEVRRLRQMLRHLVDNALAYAGAVTLSAARVGGRTVIEVVDRGPGIPDVDKQAVFERFRRGTHTEAGWGLGLFAVTRLGTETGIDVRLQDTPGGGATFVLTLPEV